jgi:rod shape-determining protein MreB
MNTDAHNYSFLHPIELPHPRVLFAPFFSHDIALDLGTANSLVYVKRRGIVLNEPSLVAVDAQTLDVLAVGAAAKEMYGKTGESIRCVRPMKDGVIADCEMTRLMIRHMIQSVRKGVSLYKPRIVIGVPAGTSQVEKRAVIDAAKSSDVGTIYLVEEPMAAALGAGLPVDQPVANMIVDIGGGTTEVAIISGNGTLYSQSIRVAGDEMDQAIQRLVRRELNMQIGIFEAERVKILLGSALPFGEERQEQIIGRDIASGMPIQQAISDTSIRSALTPAIEAIISSICTGLEQTSPETARDIISRGIYLAGGGALLSGLAERLYRETGIKFYRVQDPLTCVVRGIGRVVENLKDMQQVCISS